ncbi:MAG: transporter [Alphaproteobacteria bacterium]
MKTTVTAAMLAATLSMPAYADYEHHHDRADDHAPIGVMGDHFHAAGELMLSYRYMHMDMGGNRVGSDSISFDDTLAQFPVTPTRMTMDMHMFGAMYAPTDWLTAMVMVPYIEKDMDHITRMGGTFTTRTSGVGDVKLTGLIVLFNEPGHSLHLNAGMSFPTGSINKRDAIPINPDAQLPYPMQIGSGTYDLLPGITYNGRSDTLTWGAQLSGVIRLDTNDRNYSLGDRFQATAWGAVQLAQWISLSMRVAYEHWGNIDGADAELMPGLIQTARTDLQGGDRIDLGFGVNLLGLDGIVKGHRIAVEVIVPVYQNLNGPQMERDWSLTVGWQKTF